MSNGVPLALSALASPVQDADKVNGLSYSQFYGQIAGRVGTALNDATNNQDVQQSLLSQAKDLRQQYQGVSLDEEATILMQFQRAYQANSKFLSVLDQLTQSAIDILKLKGAYMISNLNSFLRSLSRQHGPRAAQQWKTPAARLPAANA